MQKSKSLPAEVATDALRAVIERHGAPVRSACFTGREARIVVDGVAKLAWLLFLVEPALPHPPNVVFHFAEYVALGADSQVAQRFPAVLVVPAGELDAYVDAFNAL